MPDIRIPPGFDFTDPDLGRVPRDELAELRRTAPVWWNAQRRGSAGFDDDGFWVVSRHADVRAVSLDSRLYSSWEKSALIRMTEGRSEAEQHDPGDARRAAAVLALRAAAAAGAPSVHARIRVLLAEIQMVQGASYAEALE